MYRFGAIISAVMSILLKSVPCPCALALAERATAANATRGNCLADFIRHAPFLSSSEGTFFKALHLVVISDLDLGSRIISFSCSPHNECATRAGPPCKKSSSKALAHRKNPPQFDTLQAYGGDIALLPFVAAAIYFQSRHVFP